MVPPKMSVHVPLIAYRPKEIAQVNHVTIQPSRRVNTPLLMTLCIFFLGLSASSGASSTSLIMKANDIAKIFAIMTANNRQSTADCVAWVASNPPASVSGIVNGTCTRQRVKRIMPLSFVSVHGVESTIGISINPLKTN